MNKANTDITYCMSLTCKRKCWRHSSNFEFEEGRNYCFQDKCINTDFALNIPVNEHKKLL